MKHDAGYLEIAIPGQHRLHQVVRGFLLGIGHLTEPHPLARVDHVRKIVPVLALRVVEGKVQLGSKFWT